MDRPMDTSVTVDNSRCPLPCAHLTRTAPAAAREAVCGARGDWRFVLT